MKYTYRSIDHYLISNNLPPMFSVKYAINCCEYVLAKKPTTDERVFNALALAKRYRDGDSTVTAIMLTDAANAAYATYASSNAASAAAANAANAASAAANAASNANAYAANAASYASHAIYATSDEMQWQILKDLLNNEYSEVEQLILGLKF